MRVVLVEHLFVDKMAIRIENVEVLVEIIFNVMRMRYVKKEKAVIVY